MLGEWTECVNEVLVYCIAASVTEAIVGFFARFDECFFQYCDKELCKINTFFSGIKHACLLV